MAHSNGCKPKSVRYRRENLILTGLWYGKDPEFNVFLKPLIEETQRLDNEKIEVEVANTIQKFTVRLILMSTDTPARCKVLAMTQFNGYFGCTFCYHPGVNIEGVKSSSKNKPNIRYPDVANVELRKHSEIFEILNEMKQNEIDKLKGVQDATPLLLLADFDVFWGSPVDYMHCCLLGIMNLLLSLWFDSKNHNHKFYIGRPNQLKVIDKIIANLRMPRTFTRQPRSIGDLKYYKASEFLKFLLHYGPVILDGILPQMYLQHFCLFSDAIFLFSKSCISPKDFADAESSLKKFHKEFSGLYGDENLVYNTHLLIHIPHCVIKFGPIWAFSNFPFEDFNGVLKSYVSGTTDVLHQIISKHLLTAEMNRLKIPFWELIHATKKVKKFEVLGDVTLFGSGSAPSASLIKMSLTTNMPDPKLMQCYKSCKYLGETFTVFKNNVKCVDSVFKTKENKFGNIIDIIKINENVYVFATMFRILGEFTPRHLIKVAPDDKFELVPITNVAEKCIWVETRRHSILSSFPNRVERY